MKEIKTIVKERVAKPIEYEEKEVEKIVYEAEDGAQFYDKKDCEAYTQRKNLLSKLKIVDTCDYNIMPEDLYTVYFESPEDLMEFINYKYSRCRIINNNPLIFPQYYCFEFSSGGDYQDSVYVYSESNLKEWFKSIDKLRKELYENNTHIR